MLSIYYLEDCKRCTACSFSEKLYCVHFGNPTEGFLFQRGSRRAEPEPVQHYSSQRKPSMFGPISDNNKSKTKSVVCAEVKMPIRESSCRALEWQGKLRR